MPRLLLDAQALGSIISLMNLTSQHIKYIIRAGALFLAIIIIIAAFPIVIIGAGHRGVVFNNISGIENRILGEGVHFRIPFVQTVTQLSVKVQKTDIKAEAASKDLQTINTDIVVNWHLNASKVNRIFQQVGNEEAIAINVLTPSVSEVVKAATAQKTASEILEKRSELKADIDKALSGRLKRYDVLLDDVSIVNVTFSAEFNAAIEQKQVAQQQAEQAKFLAEKALNEAEAAVNKARGEAEAQRLLQQSLNPDLLQKLAIEKWDGKFPQYVGTGTLPFIQIK